VDLIRPAASPLEAASRLISGKLSADDPNRTLEKYESSMEKQWGVLKTNRLSLTFTKLEREVIWMDALHF
jgi:hypothetical protein